MRKLLIIPILFLALWPTAAFSAVEGKNPTLIADSLTPDQIKDLNIVVPKSTDSGFQVLTIQVYDKLGVQSEQHVYFCKDLAGKIHWDNKCPEFDPLATKEELSVPYNVDSLPRYSPAQESKKSAGIIAAAVALLLVLASARDKFDAASTATFVSLAANKKQGSIPLKRWGDRSNIWNFAGTARTDNFFKRSSEWLSERSLILARIVGDGDYARAMFGSLAVLPILGAPLLGFHAAQANSYFYAVPQMPYFLAIIAVGVFDASAGFVAGWTFVLITMLKNPPQSIDSVLLLIAVALLGYAPVLIAAAARAFRRFTYDSQDRWEKLVDYFLAPVIGLWAVIKIIEGLNGFIGRQFLISYYAIPIGIFTGLMLLLRMFVEEFSNRVFTWRIHHVVTEYRNQRQRWHLLGIATEIAIAIYFAYRFTEWNKFVLGAVILGFIPKIVHALFRKKIPQSKVVHYLTPKGIFLTILLIYCASAFHDFVRGYFTNSSQFLLWWIVIASVPVFIFAFIKLFAKSGLAPFQYGPVTRYIWRFASIVVYLALLAAVFEVAPDKVTEAATNIDVTNVFDSLKSGLGL
jgi:hypothetical protein